VDLNDSERKIFSDSLRSNKEFLKSQGAEKEYIDADLIRLIPVALDYRDRKRNSVIYL